MNDAKGEKKLFNIVRKLNVINCVLTEFIFFLDFPAD